MTLLNLTKLMILFSRVIIGIFTVYMHQFLVIAKVLLLFKQRVNIERILVPNQFFVKDDSIVFKTNFLCFVEKSLRSSDVNKLISLCKYDQQLYCFKYREKDRSYEGQIIQVINTFIFKSAIRKQDTVGMFQA